MLNINIATDTDLGQRAIAAVDEYVRGNLAGPLTREDDWPVARAQIMGLRQIAANEPAKVGEFTEHQRIKVQAKLLKVRKEEKRRVLQAELDFWEHVTQLCQGTPATVGWSLAQACGHARPAELIDEKHAPGTQLTKEQHAARKDKKEKRDAWDHQWKLDNYAGFFQRFCAHYLYKMSQRTQGE